MTRKLPILLIGYYRPDFVTRMMQAIGEYGPEKLYVACDGPRPGEEKLVSEVRKILAEPSWDVTVNQRFLSKNEGPGRAISGAIDWFFDHEQEGIILEEDCLPNQGFFELAEHVIEKYRDNPSVWGLTGSNTARLGFDASYGFVQQPLIWGWATWADRWHQHDKSFASFHKNGRVKEAWPSAAHRLAIARHLRSMARFGVPDTWDYPFAWTVMSNRGLWVVPSRHLIDNIGAGEGALNSNPRRFRKNTVQELGEIVSPHQVAPDYRAEKLILRRIHGLCYPLWLNYPLNGLKILKNWLHRETKRILKPSQ